MVKILAKESNRVYFYGETTSPKGNVDYNGHQWIIYDINDKLGVKLAGDQNVPADVFPMTVNIAAYQAYKQLLLSIIKS